MFESTRFRPTLRKAFGELHREFRILLTPDVLDRKWTFILGCYNSGTELLMTLLGEHPAIASLPVEGQFLTDQFPKDYDLGLPRMWVLREDLFRMTGDETGPDARRIRKEWLMRLDRTKPVFVEKSPPNTPRARWLQKQFENSHFIALVRNGYAVAEGIRRKAEPHHMKNGWPIDLCARQWARTYEVLLEDEPALERVLWVRYEDLVERPRDEFARILGFLGLPEPEAWLDVDRTRTVHEREEPLRNFNTDSISRLSRADIDVISSVAGPMLEHFGYERPTAFEDR